jgi:hydroxypyruvate isomerase
MLYNELGFIDRFAAARADGFTAVEFMFPFAFRKSSSQTSFAMARNLLERLHATRVLTVQEF